jgi:hypothetical protein
VDTEPLVREQSQLLFGDQISLDWHVFYWASGPGQPGPTRSANAGLGLARNGEGRRT